ncbi:corrinoid protein [Desulfosporosinus metallidurans]|uniref:Methyltransferase corrinoid protein n=1 Tax=Desulfosporosinus metallidurans TaxID=1888891 RepID=A0A1Q8QXE2_9FIRM|nr:corrinoid protein [Desulfosporosinus metallidurans]OLN31965.1 Methyltransferase corrinoid protein [Desulfosporosinus metallidurans]
MKLLNEIQQATIDGRAPEVAQLTQQALDEVMSLDDIINEGFISAMSIIGEKFKNNEIFVPEMLIAARAMKAGLKVLEPLMLAGERKYLGKIIIGTVKGDLHDIGKNLLGMMLQGGGYEVIDLGVDVTPDKFLAAVKEHQPQVVGLSALLTTTMPFMKETVKVLGESGLRDQIKILVGGAPISQRFADEIGADGYAADAGSAVELVKAVLS